MANLKKTKKKMVVLIGARLDGHAGVVLDVIREYDLYEVVGFLDDELSLHHKDISGIPLLGSIESYFSRFPLKETLFFVSSGNNIFRESCYDYIKKKGLNFVNVIHPSAVISQSAKIGKGVFVGANVSITHNVTIGNGVLINTSASIDHDNIIEDFVNISPGCHTSGRVRIKKKAFLGSGVSIIPDITIGEDAVIGAGAVVIGDIAANTKVAGVPAKEIE